MNLIKKRLRKRLGKLVKKAKYSVRTEEQYLIKDVYGDYAKTTKENMKKVRKYYNSLNTKEKEEFSKTFDLNDIDDDDDIEYILNSINHMDKDNYAEKIGLEIAYGYYVDDEYAGQNCDCMYLNEKEAEEIAEKLNEEYERKEDSLDDDEEEISNKDLQKFKFDELTDNQVEKLVEILYNEVGFYFEELGIDTEKDYILPSSKMEFDQDCIKEWLEKLEKENDGNSKLPDPSTWKYYKSKRNSTDFKEATREEYIKQLRNKNFEKGIMEYIKDNFDKEKLQDLSNLIFK